MKKLVLSLLALAALASLAAVVYLASREPGIVSLHQQARNAHEEARLAEAVTKFHQVLELDPNHVEALQSLSIIAREQGRFRAAADYRARLRSLDPLNPEHRTREAIDRLAYGDFPAVLRLLDPPHNSPPDEEHSILLAKAYLQAGRPADAEEVLAPLMDATEPAAEASLLCADLAFSRGHWKEAELLYDGLVGKPGVSSAALAGLGNVYLAMDQFDEAERFFQRATEEGKGSFQSVRILAEFYTGTGRIDKAIPLWESLLERYPQAPEAILPLAESRAASENREGLEELSHSLPGGIGGVSLQHYLAALHSHLLKNDRETLQSLEWSRGFAGHRPFFLRLELEASARTGELAALRRCVRELGSRGFLAWSKPQVAAILAREASSAWDKGDRERSVELSEVLLEIEPSHDTGRTVLMRAALARSDWLEASKRADALLSSGKARAEALEVRGCALLEQDRLEEAAGDFDELQQLTPDSPLAAYWLGVVRMRQKRYPEAIHLLETAQEKAPESSRVATALFDTYAAADQPESAKRLAVRLISAPGPSTRSIGHLFLAACARESRDSELAIHHYRKAISESSNKLAPFLALTDTLLELERYPEAREVLTQANELRNNHPYVRFKQALCEQVSGHEEQATILYRELLETYPNWALVQVNLSDLLAEKPDHREEARRLAERAVHLAPEWPDAHLALARRLEEEGANEDALDARNRANALLTRVD